MMFELRGREYLLALLVSAMAITASAWVAVPATVTRYNSRRDVEYHHLELGFQQLNLLNAGIGCSDNCGPLALAYGFVLPASVIVSGSVVLVGNTVSWIERQGACPA